MKNTLRFFKKITPMLALAAMMMAPMWGLGQTTIFSYAGGGNAPAGWTFTNNITPLLIDQTTYWLVEAGNPSDIITTATYDLSSYSSAVFNLSIASYGSNAHNKAKIEISYDGGATYSQTETTVVTTGTTYINGGPITLSSVSSQVVLRISNNGISGRGVRLKNLVFTATGASGPAIVVNPATLTGFTYVNGSGPSAEQTFTVSGSNLTEDISIAATANYEISKASGSGYTTPLIFTQTDGNVAEQTVYVRMKAGLSAGDYDNEVITASSTGATDKTVTVSGTVAAPPPPDAPVAAAATAVTATGFTANWNASAGASGYRLDVYSMSAGTNATDLFISEYGEGSSNNKYIEIFNGTGNPVDLSEYVLKQAYNGGGWSDNPYSSYNLSLSGTLANNEVYVIANSQSNAAILAQADLAIVYNSSTPGGTVVSFTGNDAMGLFKNAVLIDVFGDPTSDLIIPVAGNITYGQDHTIVRKSSIFEGNTDWTLSSGTNTTDSEWIGYPLDTWTYLGSHTMDGGSSLTYVPGYEDLDVGNVTTYNVTGLTTGTTYYYVVRATNANGTSTNSNEIEVTTTGGNQNPVISNIVQTPSSGITSTTTVSVSADVTDSDGTVEGVELHWGTTSGLLTNNIDMLLVSGSTYTTDTDIPVQAGGTTVYYEVYTLDNDAAATTSPEQSYLVEVSEPSAHPTGFGATANSSSTITVNWTDAVPAVDGYLIKGSDVSYNDIAAPADGTPESNSLLVQNVANGIQAFQFTGLTASTPYFFKIYPYNGSAAAINYKIDGAVPEASATTDAATIYGNVETFDNFGATGSSYSTGTFIGQDGSTWNFVEARGDVEITGKALMVGRNRTPQSEVYSGTIGGGIQVLNFDYMQAFGTNVNLNVLVNDVVVGNVKSSGEQNEVKNSGDITVNVSGNFVLKFINVNNSDGQVVIDNISWNSISAFSAYNGTGNWDVEGNWSNGIPTASTDAIINGYVTVNDASECNDMTISSTGTLTVVPNAVLDVNGNLLIESNATGTGSFIGAAADYLIGGTTTVQRYLTGGWDGWDGGWHQLSSPVAAQPIADFATTGSGNDYDFYGWDEPTDTWMNYKAAGFSTWNDGTNFNEAQGYLVSYEAVNSTQTFTGVLNTADVTIENMSNGGNSWHLLGNPFASALIWNDNANWILDNVAGTAKIWHEANKSYSDIAPNGIIPSAQGFMVQVNNSSNSLLFLETARTHSATPFYKAGTEQLLLVAAETEGGSAQESKIMVNPMATEGFDFDYDSRFLAGYAPQLYSVVGDELLSTNSLPELASGKVIPLGFVKNAATAFTIQLKESIPGAVVYLTDIQTGTVTNLTENPVYSFTSNEGDDANRFTLAFGTVGINHPEATAGVQVFAHDGVLYVETPSKEVAQFSVYNLTGQLVLQGRTRGNALSTFNASALNTGVYVVNILLTDGVVSRKVVINK